MGEEFDPRTCDSLIFQTDADLPATPVRTIYADVCENFLNQTSIQKLVRSLARRSLQPTKIRKDELLFHLRTLHPIAFQSIVSSLEKHGVKLMKSNTEAETELSKMSERMSQIIDNVVKIYEQTEDLSEEIFSASETAGKQLSLLQQSHMSDTKQKKPWSFIIEDFPSYYASNLEHLLYPDWHVACFVTDPTNASMWGGYGDSHRGVCLKFNANFNEHGSTTLDLYRANSWSGSKTGIIENFDFVPHQFHEVSYTSDFPEIDFFESLGTISLFKLSGFWFSGKNGERSATALRMMQEDAKWRKDYWSKFTNSFKTKSAEWQHEKEQRLILHSNLQRFDTIESRKLKYRFTDLSGVIFGIKTSQEDKLEIIKVIRKKCAAENRDHFDFFQASYSSKTKKIEVLPLNLLRVGDID